MSGKRKPWHKCTAAFLILLLLLAIVSCKRQPSYTAAPQTGEAVVIDIHLLEQASPVFFTFHYAGKRINFFVISTGGNVLSFLDACTKCYPKKLGYAFDGDAVTCRACNERYPVEYLEYGIGSCVPIKLESYVRDGKLYIDHNNLHKMSGKFKE